MGWVNWVNHMLMVVCYSLVSAEKKNTCIIGNQSEMLEKSGWDSMDAHKVLLPTPICILTVWHPTLSKFKFWCKKMLLDSSLTTLMWIRSLQVKLGDSQHWLSLLYKYWITVFVLPHLRWVPGGATLILIKINVNDFYFMPFSVLLMQKKL